MDALESAELIDSIETQNDEILAHLQSGKSITELEAIELFHCMRLSARIYDLRARGNDIRTTMETHKIGKRRAKRYARYWLFVGA